MQHQPAPTAHDIEAALTRPRTTASSTPEPVQEPEPQLNATPAAADFTAVIERATVMRRWLEHYTALVDYAEGLALWVIILSSFIVLAV